MRVAAQHLAAARADGPGQVAVGIVGLDLPGDGGGKKAVAVGNELAEEDALAPGRGKGRFHG